MDFGDSDASEMRFAGYVEGLASVIGHKGSGSSAARLLHGAHAAVRAQSVEPMAAVTGPARTAAQHQSLLHFVGEGGWSDERVLTKVRELVLPAIEWQEPIEAWIIDDTGFPKQGRHSIGVARQYCGQLGERNNCQVAVSLSMASRYASLPVAYRLYLPLEWAADRARRRKAGVPEAIAFASKPEIALEQLRCACAAGLRRGVVLIDAGYGSDSALRAEIPRARTGPMSPAFRRLPRRGRLAWRRCPAKPSSGRDGQRRGCVAMPDTSGFRSGRLRFASPSAIGVQANWREGTAETLVSRFARVRIRVAHRDDQRADPRPAEWLLIEWPPGEDEPTKYWLSPRFPTTSPSSAWSISRSCAGASSAIIRKSSRSSGFRTSRGADRVAFSTALRCASLPTGT